VINAHLCQVNTGTRSRVRSVSRDIERTSLRSFSIIRCLTNSFTCTLIYCIHTHSLHLVFSRSYCCTPPPDWRRPPGRPRSTWLRVIDDDVQPQNFWVHTAWRKAKDRDTWHQVVSTAALC